MREGDYVFVMRAGEVIPEIVSVLTELRDGMERVVEIPKICPICSTPTMQDDGMVAIYCPNPQCPTKIQGQLELFVGKPLLERLTQSAVQRLQNQRRTVQRARKVSSVLLGQLAGAKDRHTRLAQQVIERANLDGVGQWSVGNHDVEQMNRQIGQ